jgi:excisionase family DNA binding protein
MKGRDRQPGATRLVVTVSEAAGLLAVSPRTIYRWIASGRLQTVRLSDRVVRITYADLERFIESCRDTARA